MTKRLAIIGAGSSGLICLKNAIDELPDWDIVCLEKSDNNRGCWGNPHAGFVSTSTKYTTQFACFAKYDASVNPDGGDSRSEFFRDGEYGDYLEAFADKFQLRDRIHLRCEVLKLSRENSRSRWQLTWRQNERLQAESFDSVVLATGLASEAKPIHCEASTLYPSEFRLEENAKTIQGKRVVVIGGGESAVDVARRLADPARNNQVYLSLRSGIRVSPRYHPIRGVPSDFLRNRLMLSIHPDLRNWIGQHFVAARIRYQKLFEKCFPPVSSTVTESNDDCVARKREWAMRLTDQAKGNLFDMFHNKSDDFLDAVARGEITPVGAPVDDSYNLYRPFGEASHFDETSGIDDAPIEVNPDWIVPAIGFRTGMGPLTEGQVTEQEFYLGCIHVNHPDLFLIGFARPVIGNIPTISEMQARYVCGMISGKWDRPASIDTLHRKDLAELKNRFKSLDLSVVYPVEMFPYCDNLARRMNAYPSVRAVGSLSRWSRMQLAPATTLHYVSDQQSVNASSDQTPVYLPAVLTVLLLLLKPVDAVYRLFKSRGNDDRCPNADIEALARSTETGVQGPSEQ